MSNNTSPIKLKVLLVTHYYPEHRGGIEIVAGKLTEYLTREGQVEIKWIASNVDPHPAGINGLRCLPISSTNFIENNIHIPYPLWSIPSLYRLWKTIQSADVIHLHDYLYMGNLAAFLFAKIHSRPVVITQHIGFIPYKSPLFRGLLSLLNRTLGRFVLKNANQVVFISEVVQKYFSEKTCFRCSPLMIPNGVDTNMFFSLEEQQRKKIRQDLGLPLEKPIFLFVGRFVEKKGLPILKCLAQRFQSIQWLFAGWGDLNPELWALPNVHVFRDRCGTKLTPLYQAADLLVLPSKGEGFPLVIQEAMASGTPVMVSSETAEAYRAAKHLIFSEEIERVDAVERWSLKIEEFLQDSSTLAALRPQVATFARQHWCWENCAAQYYQIFKKLTNMKIKNEITYKKFRD